MSMPVGGSTNSSTSTGSGNSAQSAISNQLGEQAFLQLLIAELKNQDPNQPMDGQAMITQLAQLNQTQAAMQSATYQQENFASSLIGKTVTGTVNGKPTTGTPTGMTINGNTIDLIINGQSMNITSVTNVGNTTTSTTGTGTSTGTGSGTTTTTTTNGGPA